MQNIKGIEPFMAEFISGYSKFLRSVKKFKIESSKSKAFQFRTIIPNTYKLFYGLSVDGGCIYDINPPPDTFKTVEKGTLEELVAKEEELRAKLADLGKTYDIHAMPYFKFLNGSVAKISNDEFLWLPQYDLFVSALEFSLNPNPSKKPRKRTRSTEETLKQTTEQKIAIRLFYDDEPGGFYEARYALVSTGVHFEPRPILPGVRMPQDYNDSWLGIDHPNGRKTGHMFFNISGDYDGQFYVDNVVRGERHPLFEFSVWPIREREITTHYALYTSPSFKLSEYGKGYLTVFLEMLKEGVLRL
ncbi:hypothetical protein HY636_02680 [Candidatus Woesearchaeota archaeon]|nr:hypothetical protein [Candidatus Woesearchaeota archaeon]